MAAAPPLVLFGPAHLAAIVLPIMLGTALAVAMRRNPSHALSVRVGLAGFLVAMTTLHVLWVIDHRGAVVWEFIPLHLCDLSIFVALLGLASKRRLCAELLYFWTCSGTFLATLLPACEHGFPNLRFFIYFSLHGGVIISAIVLVYGLQLYPDRRSPLRVFGLTLVYAAAIALIDVIWAQNYLFLAHKPPQQTMLDYMGPWPVYIFVGLAIGLAIFYLLNWPFRRRDPG